jgi:hypothetical protein
VRRRRWAPTSEFRPSPATLEFNIHFTPTFRPIHRAESPLYCRPLLYEPQLTREYAGRMVLWREELECGTRRLDNERFSKALR